MTDTWDPARYHRFSAERRQPFDDLVALLDPIPAGSAIDLGCGSGELTAELHTTLGAATTVGIDTSPAMLGGASGLDRPGLSFEVADLGSYEGGPFDVVASNAALQWVPEHPALLRRLVGLLRPGGQLAFQVPANGDHVSHVLARQLAGTPQWRDRFAGGPPPSRHDWVLAPERYAELLDALGLDDIHVRLQVYGHHLEGPEAVVEWVQGTLLTPYERRLTPDAYVAFVDEYRSLLLEAVGPARPYFYAFKRILVRARRL